MADEPKGIEALDVFEKLESRVTDEGLALTEKILADSKKRNFFFLYPDKALDFIEALKRTPHNGPTLAQELLETPEGMVALAQTFNREGLTRIFNTAGAQKKQALFAAPGFVDALLERGYGDTALDSFNNANSRNKVTLFATEGMRSLIKSRFNADVMTIIKNTRLKTKAAMFADQDSLHSLVCNTDTQQIINILKTDAREEWSKFLTVESVEILSDFGFGMYINPFRNRQAPVEPIHG